MDASLVDIALTQTRESRVASAQSGETDTGGLGTSNLPVYAVSKFLTAGDVVRVFGQLEVSERSFYGTDNTVDAHLRVQTPSSSEQIGSTVRQLATRAENHHMPLFLGAAYRVTTTGTHTFQLQARKSETSVVVVEDRANATGVYGHLALEVYRSNRACEGKALKELKEARHVCPAGSGSYQRVYATTPAFDVSRLDVNMNDGDYLYVHSMLTGRYIDGAHVAMHVNELLVDGSRLSNTTENVSGALYRLNLQSSAFFSLPPGPSRSVAVQSRTYGEGDDFDIVCSSQNALAALRFGATGSTKSYFLAAAPSHLGYGKTITSSGQTILIETPVTLRGDDIVRAQSNVQLYYRGSAATSCMTYLALVEDSSGRVLQRSTEFERFVSPRFREANIAARAVFKTTAAGPARVFTYLSCPGIDSTLSTSASEQHQVIEQFSAVP